VFVGVIDASPLENRWRRGELILQAPAAMPLAGCLHLYANLSGMLPHRPLALDGDFARNFSQNGAACDEGVDRPIEHHSQVCPTCSHRLTGHRCKLLCTQCGYFLSCADYY
jgi:hypothetical protein